MVNKSEIIGLGWTTEDKANKGAVHFEISEQGGGGYWLMSFCLTAAQEDGFHTVMINWVDETVKVNRWENSDTHFYGGVKTKEELKTIMRLLFIIEY